MEVTHLPAGSGNAPGHFRSRGNTGWLGKWPGFMMLEHFLPQNRFTLLREML